MEYREFGDFVITVICFEDRRKHMFIHCNDLVKSKNDKVSEKRFVRVTSLTRPERIGS